MAEHGYSPPELGHQVLAELQRLRDTATVETLNAYYALGLLVALAMDSPHALPPRIRPVDEDSAMRYASPSRERL